MPTPSIKSILSDAGLLVGWNKVRENQGGPGVDRQTISHFKRRLTANLNKLREEVINGSYRPQPLLQVEIPKKIGGLRTLSIPSVRDRVLQSAVAVALTPIFEAEFEDVSFAYRRNRSVDKAIQRVVSLREQGYQWVVDADIHQFFDQVDHDLLMVEVWVFHLIPDNDSSPFRTNIPVDSGQGFHPIADKDSSSFRTLLPIYLRGCSTG